MLCSREIIGWKGFARIFTHNGTARLYGVHKLSERPFSYLRLLYVRFSMCMVATIAMLTMPAREPGTLLRFEHSRRDTSLGNSVSIVAVLVITLASLPCFA